MKALIDFDWEAVADWFRDEELRGIVPHLLAAALLAPLVWQMERLIVKPGRFVTGLEHRTLYNIRDDQRICAGYVVRHRSEPLGRTITIQVAAEEGAVLTLAADGYALDGAAHRTDATWRERARATLGESTSLTVPEGHLLLINVDPHLYPGGDRWAFEIVPREAITKRVSRVLFSLDPAQIGTPVGPDCDRG